MIRRSKKDDSGSGKKRYHEDQKLLQIWLSEEDHLKAKLVAKRYGVSMAGFFRLSVNQAFAAVQLPKLEVPPLPTNERDGEEQ